MTEDEKKHKLLLWAGIRYFTSTEFDCPGLPFSGLNMNIEFIKLLDKLRDKCGFPLTITSGYRTPEHNSIVGGVDSSSHESGLACDIAVGSSDKRDAVLKYSFELGLTRRGIGHTLIHLDLDYTKPQNVTWVYMGK